MTGERMRATANDSKPVTLRVFHFRPERERTAEWQEYVVPARPGMTVLDALLFIKERHDGSLAYRSSCRMGICGSCGIFLNGRPRLACQTQVRELGRLVIVAPLPNYPVIKDLVPDLEVMVTHHAAVYPYIIRADEEQERPTAEYLQAPHHVDAYLQFAYCIKCGICLAACPTLATDPDFLGPQALAQAYRYSADSRDAGAAKRLKSIDGPQGIWRCHLAGACTDACPKGVDPALAIQLLKRLVVADALRIGGRQRPAVIAPPNAEAQPRAEIPGPPPPTVGTGVRPGMDSSG